jgi:hypothetical protein
MAVVGEEIIAPFRNFVQLQLELKVCIQLLDEQKERREERELCILELCIFSAGSRYICRARKTLIYALFTLYTTS